MLAVALSERGSYLQQLLVEEAVAAADAVSREAATNLITLLLGPGLWGLPAAVTRRQGGGG